MVSIRLKPQQLAKSDRAVAIVGMGNSNHTRGDGGGRTAARTASGMI
ncbi:MAG: hypothetical protein U0528_20245 [Anaerolineae bacterium]